MNPPIVVMQSRPGSASQKGQPMLVGLTLRIRRVDLFTKRSTISGSVLGTQMLQLEIRQLETENPEAVSMRGSPGCLRNGLLLET